MKTTHNVIANDLMVDDHLKVAGMMYRVSSLSLNFGRGYDTVRIHLQPLDKRTRSFLTLTVPADTLFKIHNQ